MKTLLAGCLFILILSRATYASEPMKATALWEPWRFPETTLETQEEKAAWWEATPEERSKYRQCLKAKEQANCIQDVFGDIYN